MYFFFSRNFHFGSGIVVCNLNTRIPPPSGNAGDPFHSMSYDMRMQSMRFSTFDSDNDLDTGGNCALTFTSGWWFNKCFQVSFCERQKGVISNFLKCLYICVFQGLRLNSLLTFAINFQAWTFGLSNTRRTGFF